MGLALIRALSTHPTLELVAAGIRPGTHADARAAEDRGDIGARGRVILHQQHGNLVTMPHNAPRYTNEGKGRQ